MGKMFGRLIEEKIGEYISNVRSRSVIDETNERIFHSNTIIFRKKCIDKESVGNLPGETLATRRIVYLYVGISLVPMMGKI